MVRMRDAAAVFAVAIMILSVFPIVIPDDGSEASGDLNGLLIYEVQPKNENDGFALKNYGTSAVNLSGYYVKDGNGTVKTYTFGDTSIAAGKVAVFVKKTIGSDDFSTTTTDRTVYKVTDNKVNLDNSGDALFLYDPSDNLVDAVYYGKYTATTGWSGPAVDLGFKEDVIRRCETNDSDTYFDWVAVGRGYSAKSFSDTVAYDADSVKAFTFPDSGGKPVLEALRGATSNIKISIYMITSEYVGAILKDRVEHGVNVQIILEKKPLGYDQSDYAWILKDVSDNANGEVKYIGGGDYDRYSYVHNKYAIIDGDEVVITSENWTAGNISTNNGNRGWGAVVYNADFATYMNEFFTNDWTFADDFATFSSVYSDKGKTLASLSAAESYISGIADDKSQTFSGVKASIYMSPDNTFKALQYLIDNATDRVYTEQMDIGTSYLDLSTLSPLSAFSRAANRGVDARFMITASGNTELVDTLNTTTNIKAAGMGTSGYATMHNKGVIVDDTVWVSSVNWTDNAFMNNRECGLYLQSASLTDYYLSAYMYDWNKNYKLTDTLTVVPNLTAGTFTVKNATSTYSWVAYDESGNVLKEATGSTFTLDSVEGVGSVKVTDADSKTGRYIISGATTNAETDTETGNKEDVPVKEVATYGGIAAVILAALLLIWKFVFKGAKKTAKKTVKKTVKKTAKKSTKKK